MPERTPHSKTDLEPPLFLTPSYTVGVFAVCLSDQVNSPVRSKTRRGVIRSGNTVVVLRVSGNVPAMSVRAVVLSQGRGDAAYLEGTSASVAVNFLGFEREREAIQLAPAIKKCV